MTKKYIYNGIEFAIGNVIMITIESAQIYELPRNIYKILDIKSYSEGFYLVIDAPIGSWFHPGLVESKVEVSSQAYDTLFGGGGE